MKAVDSSVKMLGLRIVTSSVTFIKSANQSSIKPCLIMDHVLITDMLVIEVNIVFSMVNGFMYKYMRIQQAIILLVNYTVLKCISFFRLV